MNAQPSARSALGRVGLPEPVTGLAARTWDVVVVGGGHNGLTAAAYLARAGRSVLVLERREQLGGACTLEQPFSQPDYVVSPCAYLVGLLHPKVIAELDLPRYGFEVQIADPHLWCPFDDGTALALWNDGERTARAVAEFAPSEVDGYLGYEALFGRIRSALRPLEGRDVWLGDAPSRAEIEELLGGDEEAISCLFEDPIADVIDRYVKDERLRTALHGQGTIGTFAGPKDPGTAGVHWMHTSGHLQGEPGAWGYVTGGMGQVSFAIADAARDLGAVVASGVPVAAIEPDGDGVVVATEGGERIRARAVVANADPTATLRLLGDAADPTYRTRAEQWRSESPVVKLNCALSRLPRFTAADAGDLTPYRAMVTISTGLDDTQAACEAARRGEPAPAWCELYFQSAYDPSVAPAGKHVMSVFAQYAPYRLARGTWDERREEIGDAVLATIARFAPDVADAVEQRQVLGPPDVEARVGLTGGHIFQGECLPEQMWQGRWAPRLSVPGVYLCGAATHPGGSVIGANGRNAAMAVLDDLGTAS